MLVVTYRAWIHAGAPRFASIGLRCFSSSSYSSCAGSAFADSQASMTFLGHAGTDRNPVYPWYFQVNGVPTTLICDTLNNLNIRGENWQANVTNILNGPTKGLFQGNTLIDYEAAAVIFSDILFHGANASDANWAIWALFTPGAKNSKYFNADALALYNAALALAPKLPKSFFNNYVIYTPIPGTQSCKSCGLPQEFIGYSLVPEPGTVVVWNRIVALASALRKKLARPKFEIPPYPFSFVSRQPCSGHA